MKLTELEAVIEAALFLSGDALPISEISKMINMDKATSRAIVQSLAEKYITEQRGLRIVEINQSYQMCTAAQCFTYIRNQYPSSEKQGMTQTILETLAIIAYRQPITKSQIEEIRGVNADHSVNKLVEKGLVCEKGRSDAPGKPILFGTTTEFLRYFGFHSVEELPPLAEIQKTE